MWEGEIFEKALGSDVPGKGIGNEPAIRDDPCKGVILSS